MFDSEEMKIQKMKKKLEAKEKALQAQKEAWRLRASAFEQKKQEELKAMSDTHLTTLDPLQSEVLDTNELSESKVVSLLKSLIPLKTFKQKTESREQNLSLASQRTMKEAPALNSYEMEMLHDDKKVMEAKFQVVGGGLMTLISMVFFYIGACSNLLNETSFLTNSFLAVLMLTLIACPIMVSVIFIRSIKKVNRVKKEKGLQKEFKDVLKKDFMNKNSRSLKAIKVVVDQKL